MSLSSFFSDFNLSLFMINFSLMYAIKKHRKLIFFQKNKYYFEKD